MAYTETTTVGYGTRVGNSFKGIGSGILMFLAGTALLWWNEGNFVKMDKALNEAEGNYEELSNIDKIDADKDGQLIYATGVAKTADSLVDDQFGIGVNAVKMQRTVEYYQWVEQVKEEKKDKLGGSQEIKKTYTYKQEWVSQPVQSSQFKDPAAQSRNRNFVLTTVEPESKQATKVTFGAFELSESQISSISGREPLELNIDSAKLVSMSNQARQEYQRNTTTSYGMSNTDTAKYVHADQNVLYFGQNPGAPAVGDVRVTWTYVKPENKISIIAKQKDNSFTAYKAKNGKTIQMLTMGTKAPEEMFQDAHDSNDMMLWVWRIVGIMLVIGGLKGIFGFLETILKVVPFLAGIFGWGVGVVCTVVGFVWSLIIIALAWLFYRPVIGITILAIAGFLIWVFAFKGKDKLKELAANAKNRSAAQPAATAVEAEPQAGTPVE
ncbi:MAG: TMEM43 family protein [Prevotella sp.]|nr:TMEM43 family protein [Prevotella sp.]